VSRPVRIAFGFPWYNGPDVDTFALYMEHMYYYGRMREREVGADGLLKLDHIDGDVRADLHEGEGPFEFFIASETRMSLVGLARERLVDMALGAGCDYLFCWDADMRFPMSTMLQLYRHKKPVVNALAFTAREPVMPCLYKQHTMWDPVLKEQKWGAETIWDIPDKRLITNEDVGGKIAFGAGVVLYNLNVFRQIPKPWFTSTGCGEDWFFCHRAHEFNVPLYVDTSIFVEHKAHKPVWISVDTYNAAREENPEEYEKLQYKQELAKQL